MFESHRILIRAKIPPPLGCRNLDTFSTQDGNRSCTRHHKDIGNPNHVEMIQGCNETLFHMPTLLVVGYDWVEHFANQFLGWPQLPFF